MIKRMTALALGLALLVPPVQAELQTQTVSANSTAQTITVTGGTLVVINDGSNEIYVRVFHEGETAADATTSNAQIKSGETFTFTKDFNITKISIVCAAAETATVRLFYW